MDMNQQFVAPLKMTQAEAFDVHEMLSEGCRALMDKVTCDVQEAKRLFALCERLRQDLARAEFQALEVETANGPELNHQAAKNTKNGPALAGRERMTAEL